MYLYILVNKTSELVPTNSNYVTWASSQLGGTDSDTPEPPTRNEHAATDSTVTSKLRAKGRGGFKHRSPLPATAAEQPDLAQDQSTWTVPQAAEKTSPDSVTVQQQPPSSTLVGNNSSTYQKPMSSSLGKPRDADNVEDLSSSYVTNVNDDNKSILPEKKSSASVGSDAKKSDAAAASITRINGSNGKLDTSHTMICVEEEPKIEIDDFQCNKAEEMSMSWSVWLYSYTQGTTMHGISYVTRHTRFVLRR